MDGVDDGTIGLMEADGVMMVRVEAGVEDVTTG